MSKLNYWKTKIKIFCKIVYLYEHFLIIILSLCYKLIFIQS